jgi:predicted metal-binding membrane protein
MPQGTVIEAVLKRDRTLVLTGIVAITALAWAYMVYLAWRMGDMDMGSSMEMGGGMAMEMAMPQMQAWGPMDLVLMFVMWAVMMVAMMTPSAAPMVLLFATIRRKRSQDVGAFASTFVFLSGYLAVWTAYSLLATLAQWGLHSAALLSPMMVTTSPIVGGAILVGAGIFQMTPLKHACLKHCRSPLDFIISGWREGTGGAFHMGLSHGVFCTGCCWILMLLLFVAGVMNLLWIGLIAAFVLAEKALPKGEIVARVAGVILMLVGIGVVARHVLGA